MMLVFSTYGGGGCSSKSFIGHGWVASPKNQWTRRQKNLKILKTWSAFTTVGGPYNFSSKENYTDNSIIFVKTVKISRG
jgi:hypothetical protein